LQHSSAEWVLAAAAANHGHGREKLMTNATIGGEMREVVRVLLLVLLVLIALAAIWVALGTTQAGVFVAGLAVALASATALVLLLRRRPTMG
jgi:small-conductance mechanosensitive channel